MQNQTYHRAKPWQIACFAMNNSATNAYMFLMFYISYYATGVAGLGVAIIGVISTAIRLWDGVTDPIIGALIDRTNGKFGKFRPFMILGNVILAIMVLVIYGTVHRVPESFRLLYYIAMYALYIIGYTFQTACTKAGQTCLTNDPAQRPQFTLWDSIWGCIIWAVLPMIASGSMFEKYGDFTAGYFMEFCFITIALSGVMTLIAVIGIWSHDRAEFFPVSSGEKVSMKEYAGVLKGNRALQMLVVSAASDKLAATVKSNSVLMVVLFGCLLGNYSLYGTASAIVTIPTVVVALVGTIYAAKKGMKKALVSYTWIDMAMCIALFAMAYLGFTGMINIKTGVLCTIFVGLYCILYCAETLSSGIVIPMIADCADYEAARSGLYVPGVISTLFSFVDKLISSLGTTVISLGLVAIGYTSTQPGADAPMTAGLFGFLAVMYFGLPMVGWVANLIAMKFYPLSKEKMAEIQEQIASLKAQAN